MNNIDHFYYINLDERKDRNEKTIKQLSKYKITRISAIKHTKPFYGCLLSHIKMLKIALESDYNIISICEDDNNIINPKLLDEQIKNFFSLNIKWNVLMLSRNPLVYERT